MGDRLSLIGRPRQPFGGVGFIDGDAVAIEIFESDHEFGSGVAAVGERGQLVER